MTRLILAALLALTTAPMASAQFTTLPWTPKSPARIAAENPYAPVTGQACGATHLQSYIGQSLSYAYATDAAVNARILRPGMITNMMYVADRLNLHVDANETITRISCG